MRTACAPHAVLSHLSFLPVSLHCRQSEASFARWTVVTVVDYLRLSLINSWLARSLARLDPEPVIVNAVSRSRSSRDRSRCLTMTMTF
uniref:Putative secreted peptide n=1 Tax=Anopheles braziliensis TaxID=58242 RepID=A0A2M3ZUU2_9DIPT